MVKDDFNPSEKASQSPGTPDSSSSQQEFVDCPRENCGEAIMLTELESHMSMHDVENNDEENLYHDCNTNKRPRASDSESESKFDTRLPPALRNLAASESTASSSSSKRRAMAKAGWRELFNLQGSRAKTQTSAESKRPHRRLGVSFLVCSSRPVANISIEV
jgi:zinc finger-containing ubiquitin peptidase 1